MFRRTATADGIGLPNQFEVLERALLVALLANARDVLGVSRNDPVMHTLH
jgi:hypothetical protein